MLKKVLAVDDDPYILDALVELLQYSGYDVTTTPKGDEVFDKIQQFVPDIILLDIMLSGIDGRDICRQIKGNEQTSNIPVIMISATPNLTQSVMESGANDFVSKPFDIFLLLEKIEKQLLKAS